MDIRLKRLQKKLTQYDMTNKTGIHQSRISLIENGYVKPTKDELERITEVLGLVLKECTGES